MLIPASEPITEHCLVTYGFSSKIAARARHNRALWSPTHSVSFVKNDNISTLPVLITSSFQFCGVSDASFKPSLRSFCRWNYKL